MTRVELPRHILFRRLPWSRGGSRIVQGVTASTNSTTSRLCWSSVLCITHKSVVFRLQCDVQMSLFPQKLMPLDEFKKHFMSWITNAVTISKLHYQSLKTTGSWVTFGDCLTISCSHNTCHTTRFSKELIKCTF